MLPRDFRRTRTGLGAAAAVAALTLLTGCGAATPAEPHTGPFGAPTSVSSRVAEPPPSETSASDPPTVGPSVDSPTNSGPSGRPSLTRTPTASPAPPRDAPWVGTFRGKTVKVPRGHGAQVSFTFDDGPSPTFTPQVLALLTKNDVPAVFCLIGQQARAHPDLVRKEVKAGHELCDHSRDHDLSMNRKGQAYVTKEVNDGLAAIHSATPRTPVPFYRQPGGTWSPLVVHAMHRSDLTPLRWSDDPRDWSRPGSRVIVQRVVSRLTPGAVILMHDGGGDRSQTVEALAWLLQAVKAAGWTPVLAPQHRLTDKAAARPQ